MIPIKIQSLIDKFNEQYEAYKGSGYKETLLRIDFINPFFEVLGWDIDNKSNIREDKRDVVHEDRLKIDDTIKFPDYSFCINGKRKFFVEAKKPSVNLHDDKKAIFQLRRYAWSAKLALSVLTDFEEFSVYQTNNLKLETDDNSAKGRMFYCKYNELEKPFISLAKDKKIKKKQEEEFKTNWDFIAGVFSKAAVENGSFDEFAIIDRKSGGTFDEVFLKSIQDYRAKLAQDIIQNNQDMFLSVSESDLVKEQYLNETVRKTIDRFIFLRICEDRGIEPYENLKKTINSKNCYKELLKIFHIANDKYNAGLFEYKDKKTKAVHITDDIQISDQTIKFIINDLYDCYNFTFVPLDILGQIYERFLGDKIIFENKDIKIETKPEVRKAGGVYYTPEYIIDYIVENTIGKALANKTLKTIDKFTICDPACGSGAFLIIAYEYLMNWYIEQYTKSKIKKHKECINIEKGQKTTLTLDRKKDILRQHIYGVDIDYQAVEVTKLSLLLKCLEGCTNENIESHNRLFHEQALPYIGNNIRCGNSLISTDYKAGEMFNIDERMKVNMFSWEDKFEHIFSKNKPENERGFDCVIGNPPYVFARGGNFSDAIKDYYYLRYKLTEYQINTYLLFIERGFNLLKSVDKSGILGVIIPNNWLTISTFFTLRKFILNKTRNVKIINTFSKVFSGVSVDSCILSIARYGNENTISLGEMINKEFNETEVKKEDIIFSQEKIINISQRNNLHKLKIIRKINDLSTILDEHSNSISGIKSYQIGKGIPLQTEEVKNNRIYHSYNKIDNTYKKYLQGKDVVRYNLSWSGEYISYGKWLAEPRKGGKFNEDRILVRQIPSKLPYVINATFIQDEYINDINSMIIQDITTNPLFILSILNAKITSFWFDVTFNKFSRGIFPQFKINELRRFPIPINTAKQSELAKLAQNMMDLNKQLQLSKVQMEKGLIEGQIKATDNKIDELVYKLYSLTEDEIKIVEKINI